MATHREGTRAARPASPKPGAGTVPATLLDHNGSKFLYTEKSARPTYINIAKNALASSVPIMTTDEIHTMSELKVSEFIFQISTSLSYDIDSTRRKSFLVIGTPFCNNKSECFLIKM